MFSEAHTRTFVTKKRIFSCSEHRENEVDSTLVMVCSNCKYLNWWNLNNGVSMRLESKINGQRMGSFGGSFSILQNETLTVPWELNCLSAQLQVVRYCFLAELSVNGCWPGLGIVAYVFIHNLHILCYPFSPGLLHAHIWIWIAQ